MDSERWPKSGESPATPQIVTRSGRSMGVGRLLAVESFALSGIRLSGRAKPFTPIAKQTDGRTDGQTVI